MSREPAALRQIKVTHSAPAFQMENPPSGYAGWEDEEISFHDTLLYHVQRIGSKDRERQKFERVYDP